MSSSDDRPTLRPPAERDVPSDLRARVLSRAVDGSSRAGQRRHLAGPLVAALGAAAVIIAIVVFLGTGLDESPGPSGGTAPSSTATVEPHSFVDVDLGPLGSISANEIRSICRTSLRTADLGIVRLARLEDSPMGPVPVIAYVNDARRLQYDCSPYRVTRARHAVFEASASHPIAPIASSRVQVRVATEKAGDAATYVDGVWVASVGSIAYVEARIDVGGDVGEWYQTERQSSMAFVSAWRTLTAEQLTQPLTIEYRAVTVDGVVVPVPGFETSTVDPAAIPAVTPYLGGFGRGR